MKGKTKSLVLSALAVGCSAALIAGATFAAFTSSEEYSFLVQSGDVRVSTSLDLVSMSYAAEGETQAVVVADEDADNAVTLDNGLGSASVTPPAQAEAVASVSLLLAQGTQANFTLTVSNASTVSVKYIAYFSMDTDMSSYTVNGESMEGGAFILTQSGGQRGWTDLGTSAEPVTLDFSIALPWGAQPPAGAGSMSLIVRAVQSNALGTISSGGGTFETLTDAMLSAPDGGVVRIDPGVSVQWPTAEELAALGGKSLTIAGAGTENTVFTAADGEPFVIPDNVTVRAVSFEGDVETEGRAALTDVCVAGGVTATAGTLALSGCELTNEAGAALTVAEGAAVTAEDASVTATGGHAISNSGTLTVGGESVVDCLSHARAALFNDYTGVATLNGGSFLRSMENGSNAENSGGNSFYNIQNYGTMTINEGVTVMQNGAFSSMIENGHYDGRVNTSKQEAVMVINGGTFSGGLNTIKNDDWGILTINGGTFSNQTQSAVMNYNVLTVNGGEFRVDSSADAVFLNTFLDEEMDQGILTINKIDVYEGSVLIAANGSNAGTITACTEDVLVAALQTRTAAGGAAAKAVILGADMDLTQGVALTAGSVALDLNGKTLTFDGAGIIDLYESASMTVSGNGTIDQRMTSELGYLFRLGGNSALTVNGGTYVAGLTVIQAGGEAQVSVTGGTFSALVGWNNTYWLLNLIDNSGAQIIVTGGTFVNFDPSQSQTENPEANFVADGYTVTQGTDGDGNPTYTVVLEAVQP